MVFALQKYGFWRAKRGFLLQKIFIKVYLIENKQVTLLMQLNW